MLPSVYYNEYVIEPLIWNSDKGLITNAYIIKHFKNVGKKLPVTIALWEMGTLGIGAKSLHVSMT